MSVFESQICTDHEQNIFLNDKNLPLFFINLKRTNIFLQNISNKKIYFIHLHKEHVF